MSQRGMARNMSCSAVGGGGGGLVVPRCPHWHVGLEGRRRPGTRGVMPAEVRYARQAPGNVGAGGEEGVWGGAMNWDSMAHSRHNENCW